jgi:hypothetical protein
MLLQGCRQIPSFTIASLNKRLKFLEESVGYFQSQRVPLSRKLFNSSFLFFLFFILYFNEKNQSGLALSSDSLIRLQAKIVIRVCTNLGPKSTRVSLWHRASLNPSVRSLFPIFSILVPLDAPIGGSMYTYLSEPCMYYATPIALKLLISFGIDDAWSRGLPGPLLIVISENQIINI